MAMVNKQNYDPTRTGRVIVCNSLYQFERVVRNATTPELAILVQGDCTISTMGKLLADIDGQKVCGLSPVEDVGNLNAQLINLLVNQYGAGNIHVYGSYPNPVQAPHTYFVYVHGENNEAKVIYQGNMKMADLADLEV